MVCGFFPGKTHGAKPLATQTRSLLLLILYRSLPKKTTAVSGRPDPLRGTRLAHSGLLERLFSSLGPTRPGSPGRKRFPDAEIENRPGSPFRLPTNRPNWAKGSGVRPGLVRGGRGAQGPRRPGPAPRARWGSRR